ncbi:MAG: hypothetical protein ACE365_05180 [Gammaproteobacteria bacterium]
MLHQEAGNISFRHQFEIRNALKDALGYLGIIHISMDLVRPDGEMIILSGTPSHAYEICSRGYDRYDSTISPEYYQNHSFYWWYNVEHKGCGREINYIRRVKLGFFYGFMLVRRWDDFYLVYSFAAGRKEANFIEKAYDSLNDLLRIGDEIYMNLRGLYAQYTDEFVPPLIDQFYPFVPGKPIPRYSNYYQSREGLMMPRAHEGGKVFHGLQLVVDNDLVEQG